MHIGLIGGIGPAATDLYYRGLIDQMKALDRDLQLTIVHADAPTLLNNFETKKPEAQADIYWELTQRLAKAGAHSVAITSIGGHFCIKEFRPISPLPIIDMIGTVDKFVKEHGFETVGLIGTDTVMQTEFYGGIKSTKVLVPPSEAINAIHNAYVEMALSAKVTDQQREIMFTAGQNLSDQGAEVVLLGGTDLFLAFDGQDPGFKTIDCAEVHIQAIALLVAGSTET